MARAKNLTDIRRKLADIKCKYRTDFSLEPCQNGEVAVEYRYYSYAFEGNYSVLLGLLSSLGFTPVMGSSIESEKEDIIYLTNYDGVEVMISPHGSLSVEVRFTILLTDFYADIRDRAKTHLHMLENVIKTIKTQA